MNSVSNQTEKSSKNMLFSIIIPVYNVAPFLEQCVGSVLAQTWPDIEIILVDDGSTDSSGMICDMLSQKDDRIRVVHQENGGLSAARNVGINLARGEYVLFLDSDDYWCREDMLDVLAARQKETDFQVLSFNFAKVCEGKVGTPYFSAYECASNVNVNSLKDQAENNLWISSACNKVIRRSLFENGMLRFVHGVTSEDVDWSLRLALNADRFDFIHDTMLCYRQRGSSISQSMTHKKVGVLLDNIDRCLQLLSSSIDVKAELLKPYVGYQFGTAMFNLAVLPASKEKRALVKRVKQYRYLLKWSKNRKIRMLDMAALGGMEFALLLLRIKSKF